MPYWTMTIQPKKTEHAYLYYICMYMYICIYVYMHICIYGLLIGKKKLSYNNVFRKTKLSTQQQ